MLNLPHLELFYYVAKFGGINKASRQMPRRLQPPTISAQVSQLEEALAIRLFERDPFTLTPDGAWLFEFVRPMLDRLEEVEKNLPSRCACRVRVGASEIVLYEYLPPIIAEVRRLCPEIEVSLHDGTAGQLLDGVGAGEIDLTVIATSRVPPPGLGCLTLGSLPLVLLVPRALRLTRAEQLWRQQPITTRLLLPSKSEAICRRWEEGLQRRGVAWRATMDVGSLLLLKRYVAENVGVGVTLDVPTLVNDPKVRALPLSDFDRTDIKVVWREPATPQLTALLTAIQARAKMLWP